MRTIHFALLTSLSLLLTVGPALAVQGARGPAEGVRPVRVQPVNHAGAGGSGHVFRVPLGFQTSMGHVEDLKHLGPTGQTLGGGEIVHDTNTGPAGAPLAASIGTSFQGMLQNGWIPYDAALAVGPAQVVVMTNSQWAVYDKTTGAQTFLTQFDAFFGNAAGGGFDPKCFYDAVAGRFVLLAVEQTTAGNLALVDIAVAQTSDATGPYWRYSFDETLTGTAETSTWSDYPSLGYDDNNVYCRQDKGEVEGDHGYPPVNTWSYMLSSANRKSLAGFWIVSAGIDRVYFTSDDYSNIGN